MLTLSRKELAEAFIKSKVTEPQPHDQSHCMSLRSASCCDPGARHRLIHTQKTPLGGLGAIHTLDLWTRVPKRTHSYFHQTPGTNRNRTLSA